MKKCPYCAEEIQDEAIVCRYCGRDLPEQTSKINKEKPLGNTNLPWRRAAIITILFTTITIIGSLIQTQSEFIEYISNNFSRIFLSFLFWWVFITVLLTIWQKLKGKLVLVFGLILIIVGFAIIYFEIVPFAPLVTPTHTLSVGQSTNNCPNGLSPTSWTEIDFSDRDKKVCIYGKIYKIQSDVNGKQVIFFTQTSQRFYVVVSDTLKPFIVEGSCIVMAGTVLTNIEGTPYLLTRGNSINFCPN